MMKKSKYLIPVLLLLAACGAKETPVRDLEAERLYKISTLDTTTLRTIIDPDTVEGFDLLDNLTAQAWILIDDKTGFVISEKKSRERMYIASLTKMMTCLLALEHGSDSDSVYITQSDYVSRDSRVKPDQGYLLRDLINEMMLVSDNDAAYAIARHIGGDTTAFYNKMNEKAAYLGMTATHYDNPNGLPNDSNYSSAYDQLRLVRYSMEDSVFAQVVGSREARVPLLDGRHMDCINTNRLLFTYDGCIGVKTGFTDEAGRCLVSAASQNGVTLICVTLNDRDDWNDHIALYDYGFSNISAYSPKKINLKIPCVGGVSDIVNAVCGNAEPILLGADESKRVKRKIVTESFLYAPVKKGGTVGSVEYYLDGRLLKSYKLTAENDIETEKVKTGFWQKIKELFNYG